MHFYFRGPRDVGTTATDIHTEIETQYTSPIHSHFWRLGDVGTIPKDIHAEIETQYTIPIHSHFGYLGTWEQYARIYIWR